MRIALLVSAWTRSRVVGILPGQESEQLWMLPLHNFIKLVLPVVELLADSAPRKPIHRAVTSDLMSVRLQLDSAQWRPWSRLLVRSYVLGELFGSRSGVIITAGAVVLRRLIKCIVV